MPTCACAVSDTTVRWCACDVEVFNLCNYLPIIEKRHKLVAFNFLERKWEASCGKAKFQEVWFAKWTWLHYQECNNCVNHHTHAKAFNELKMHAKSAEDVFVTRGFQDWKLATTAFGQHEISAFHKQAIERVITLPAATTDIGVTISC